METCAATGGGTAGRILSCEVILHSISCTVIGAFILYENLCGNPSCTFFDVNVACSCMSCLLCQRTGRGSLFDGVRDMSCTNTSCIQYAPPCRHELPFAGR